MKQKTITFFLALSAYGALMPTSNQPTDTTVNQKTESAPFKKRKKRLRPAIIAAIVAGSAITIGGLIAMALNSWSYKHGRNLKRRLKEKSVSDLCTSMRWDLGLHKTRDNLTQALEEYKNQPNSETLMIIRSLITGTAFPVLSFGDLQTPSSGHLAKDIAEACEEVIKNSGVKFTEEHDKIIREHINLGKNKVIQCWNASRAAEEVKKGVDGHHYKFWKSGYEKDDSTHSEQGVVLQKLKEKCNHNTHIRPCDKHKSWVYDCTVGYDPTNPKSKDPHHKTWPLLTNLAISLP